MNAAEQRAHHSRLTQLASDTAKAFEDMDKSIVDLTESLRKTNDNLDGLATTTEQNRQLEYERVNALFSQERSARDNVSRRLDALADRYYADHVRGFFGRMKWLVLGR